MTDIPRLMEITQASREDVIKLLDGTETQRRELAIENARLSAELENIANAKPSEWGDIIGDGFQAWAQSRARHALANAQSDSR